MAPSFCSGAIGPIRHVQPLFLTLTASELVGYVGVTGGGSAFAALKLQDASSRSCVVTRGVPAVRSRGPPQHAA
jgi:hypothetical protein